jgi:hypothetical protein
MATVVTAYYPLSKAKHSNSNYIQWIKNFCKFNCNLVVFTTAEYATLINNLRAPHNTHIIIKDFGSYDVTTPDMMDMWNNTYKIDPEIHIHSPELYAVWAMKQECVMLAIKENYFKSTHFVWCDIGIQRHEHAEKLFSTFPSHVETLCDPGRMLFLEVVPISHSLYTTWLSHDQVTFPIQNNTLGGGCIAGDISAWEDFSNAYIKTIRRIYSLGRFIGKDQHIFLIMLIERIIQKPYKLIITSNVLKIPHAEWLSMPIFLGGKANIIIDPRFEDTSQQVYVTYMGGLGNQLFQTAVGYAYAKKYNKKLLLPDKSHGGRPSTYFNTILHNFSDKIGVTISTNKWAEPSFSYTEIPAGKEVLYGYFQSSKYFNDVSGEIRTLFDPHRIVKNVVSQKYAELLASVTNKVVIHVRRGDYLLGGNENFHAVTTDNYFKNAIALMKQKIENPEFIIFSDDITWCREKEFFAGATFIDERADYLALHLMSQFKHYIIPNSTFSWWATWLGTPAETVIVPDRWFGPKGPKDYQDIYESHWIRIPTD